MLARILYILLAVLCFGIMIAIHEFGHFFTAKLLRVKVNEFSIGMGPLLWTRSKGETKYSFRLLPVGGFCAMEGEDEETGDPRAFSIQTWWKKVIILAAGSFMKSRSIAPSLKDFSRFATAKLRQFFTGQRRIIRSATCRAAIFAPRGF